MTSFRETRVTGGFFDVLGVTPLLGRALTRADDHLPKVPITVVLNWSAELAQLANGPQKGARPTVERAHEEERPS